jgi:hypothetical protein
MDGWVGGQADGFRYKQDNTELSIKAGVILSYFLSLHWIKKL